MITWWDWYTSIILVFYVSHFNSLESMLNPVHHTEIPHPPGRDTLVITLILFFHLPILVNSSLNNPEYRDKYPLIPIFRIYNFIKCITGIFSLVTNDYVICDSSII